MNYRVGVYKLTADRSQNELKFFFISKGAEDVVKVVQYSFIQHIDGYDVYNLGFGDYNIETDVIVDNITTENGDVYRVFNTVLSTIPHFFKYYPQAILMVQGSDSNQEFLDNCRSFCKRKCEEFCKNFNRRIKLYCSYINKNFDDLEKEYHIVGGIKDSDNQINTEKFIRFKMYDTVFLSRKNHSFMQ